MPRKLAPATLVHVVTTMAPSKHESESEHKRTVPPNTSMLHTLRINTTDVGIAAIYGPHGSVSIPRRPGDIIRSYLDSEDFLNVRLVSKALKNWIEEDISQCQDKLFSTLHINRRFSTLKDQLLSLRALKAVSPFCKHFVIHLGDINGTLIPQLYNSYPVVGAMQSLWMSVFEFLVGLLTLTISAPGEPDWHTFGSGEAQLESIRVALETKLPFGIQNITLSPTNAMGLVHFRWRGAAFKSTSWMSEAFWSRLTHLNLDLLNPLPHYHKSNRKDFIKTLHDFIGSFNRSLRVLRFSWIGVAGPNPLLLDIRYGGGNFSAPAIVWTALEEVYLKNLLAHDGDLVALRRSRCRSLRRFELEEEQIVEGTEMVVWEGESEVEDDNEVGEELVELWENSPLMFPLSL